MTAPKVRLLTPSAQQWCARSAVQDIPFWEKTRDEGECLVWTGYRDRQGYGVVGRRFVSPSPILTHRYAYYLFNGPFGNGEVIRHTCDNPPCVRPDHLLSGTQADNIRDRQVRGRHRPGRLVGEDHPAHKLSGEDVVEIRRRYRDGERIVDIARDYPVAYHTVWQIVHRQLWPHLVDAA